MKLCRLHQAKALAQFSPLGLAAEALAQVYLSSKPQNEANLGSSLHETIT